MANERWLFARFVDDLLVVLPVEVAATTGQPISAFSLVVEAEKNQDGPHQPTTEENAKAETR